MDRRELHSRRPFRNSECRPYLVDIRLENSEDDQDGVVVVSWPESQELCMYEGFYENCDFISGDTIEPCSYLVNKAWYGKLINGELQKVAEYQAA